MNNAELQNSYAILKLGSVTFCYLWLLKKLLFKTSSYHLNISIECKITLIFFNIF